MARANNLSVSESDMRREAVRDEILMAAADLGINDLTSGELGEVDVLSGLVAGVQPRSYEEEELRWPLVTMDVPFVEHSERHHQLHRIREAVKQRRQDRAVQIADIVLPQFPVEIPNVGLGEASGIPSNYLG